MLAALSGGCAIAGWAAHGVAGGKQTVKVKARYRGLVRQKVAVMVAADQYTLYGYPEAPLKISRAVSRQIAAHVKNVTLMNPAAVIGYERAHPAWIAVPYGRLVRKLGVDRIVLIDLSEYRTHEAGNAHVWRGLIGGDVGVVEARAPDPDNFTFAAGVEAQYPEETSVGMVDASDETVELGMLTLFARKAAGLFYDHKVKM